MSVIFNEEQSEYKPENKPRPSRGIVGFLVGAGICKTEKSASVVIIVCIVVCVVSSIIVIKLNTPPEPPPGFQKIQLR